MAFLDEPEVKPLADAIREIVKRDGLKPEFAKPTEEAAIEDVVLEAASAVWFFPDWYFDEESSVNTWVPGEPTEALDSELFPIVRDYVEEVLNDLRDPDAVESITYEPDEEKLVNDLVGLVLGWQDWYYTLKEEKDMLAWYDSKGDNESAYYQSDYGDVDKNPGISNAYDDDNAPWDDLDIFEIINTDLL